MDSSGENESVSAEGEDFFLMRMVSSPDGEETCVKLQDGEGIFAFKMKVANMLYLLMHSLNLIYKLKQQPNIVFSLNTNKDVEYLLDVCETYNCILMNVQAKINGGDASMPEIAPLASQM